MKNENNSNNKVVYLDAHLIGRPFLMKELILRGCKIAGIANAPPTYFINYTSMEEKYNLHQMRN